MNTLRSLVAPISVNYELTQVCNLRCSFCFSNSATHRHKQPKQAHIKAIIEALAEAEVFEIRWFGGEFTSFKQWQDMLLYAKELGFFMGFVSNGTLIGEDDARFLADNGIDGGAMSLHGPKAIHDQVVGVDGSFNKTIQAIRWCHKNGVSITALFTPTKGNFSHLPEMAHWLHENQVPITEIDVGRLCPSGEAVDDWEDQHLTLEDYYQLFAIMREIKESTGINVYMGDAFPLCLLPVRDWNLVTGCWQGTGFGHVATNGDVKSCSILQGVYGNLLQTPLRQIWTDALSQMRKLDYLPRQCRYCPHFCGGGCSATRANVSHYAPDQFIPSPEEENLVTMARRLPKLLEFWADNLTGRFKRHNSAPIPDWTSKPRINCDYRLRQEQEGYLGFFRHAGVLELDSFSAQAIQLMNGQRTIVQIEQELAATQNQPRWRVRPMLGILLSDINQGDFLSFNHTGG